MWTLLIVEDDDNLLFSLTEWLELTGRYQVHAAKSVAEGRTLLGRLEIDAALLDLALPDGSGAQLLSEIRARWGDEATVVLMSGFASVPSAVEFVKQGANDCLCKPFELAEVERRLRALLERQGPLPKAAGPLAPAPSVHLTATQAQVLAWLRQGKPDAAIAQVMGIRVCTVQNHVGHLLATLGVANRTEAVALSYRCDLLLPALAEGETETGAGKIPAKMSNITHELSALLGYTAVCPIGCTGRAGPSRQRSAPATETTTKAWGGVAEWQTRRWTT